MNAESVIVAMRGASRRPDLTKPFLIEHDLKLYTMILIHTLILLEKSTVEQPKA